MIGEAKDVTIDVDGKSSIVVRHYQSKGDGSWRTRIDLPEGLELRTLDAERAIKLCQALLKAVAEIETIESGAGDTPESKLYEEMDPNKNKAVAWLYGDQDKVMGWTADLYPLVTGHWSYCLSLHKGPNRTYSRLIHGAYEDQLHALQAAILEFREYTRR